MPVEAVGPHADGLVHATQAQRHVAELLADAHDLRTAVLRRDRARVPVVRGRLAVRVQVRRGVAGLLEEAQRAAAHRLELLRRHAALAPERGRAAVVLGEQRHDLLGAVPGALLHERAHLEVLPRADGLGQHAVGHVPDQHVLERQLALAEQRPAGGRRQDVLLLKRHERPAEVSPLRLRPASRARPPGTFAPPPRPAARAGARTRRASRAARPAPPARCPGSSAASTLPSSVIRRAISSANSGLPPERSATAGTTSWPSGSSARTSARLCSSLSGSRKSCVAERRPPPQPGAAVEQLVARQADEHERRAHPLGEVLDGVEQAVVGPVDVLEGDHERVPVGDRLDAAAQSGEEGLAHALRVVLLRHELGRHVHAEQPADERGLPVRGLADPAHQLADVGAQLAPGLLGGVRLDDPALVAQHLAERPEHDAAPVGEAAAGAHGRSRRMAPEARLELAQQARLADACLADDRDEVRRSLADDALVEAVERGQLLLAPHERRLARRRHTPHRVLRDQPDRLPGGHRLGLSLQRRAAPAPRSSTAASVERIVRSPTVTLPGRAALWSRDATFTVSPTTV